MKKILARSLFTMLALIACLIPQGCFSSRNVQPSRLQQIQSYPGIKYIVIEDVKPLNRIWILSDLEVTEQDLTAYFEPAPEGFGHYIDSINSNQEYRANQDFVYIYVQPAFAQQITDRSRQTLGFSQIKKTVVFEPDQAETNGAICLGLVGVGGVITAFFWIFWAF
jgi:hypothetical protein